MDREIPKEVRDKERKKKFIKYKLPTCLHDTLKQSPHTLPNEVGNNVFRPILRKALNGVIHHRRLDVYKRQLPTHRQIHQWRFLHPFRQAFPSLTYPNPLSVG